MSRTFRTQFNFETAVVVPDNFVADRIADVEGDDASEFLKAAAKQFKLGTPDEDAEGFTEHIVRHGIRRFVQVTVADLIRSSGMTGTVSPLKAAPISPL